MVLGGETFVKQPALASCRGVKLSLDLTIDLVVESRHRWEKCGLQDLAIFGKLERVTLIVALRSTANHNGDEHELIEHMGSRQVVDGAIIRIEALAFVEDESRPKDTPVAHLDTL